jgi:hypothetical protein
MVKDFYFFDLLKFYSELRYNRLLYHVFHEELHQQFAIHEP